LSMGSVNFFTVSRTKTVSLAAPDSINVVNILLRAINGSVKLLVFNTLYPLVNPIFSLFG
jgi:hypothetical protein